MHEINEKQRKFAINFIFYMFVFCVVCLYGITHAYAYTYENIGYFNDKTQIQVEVNYTSQPLSVAINQHVQLKEVYSIDIFVSNIDFSPDNVYQFEIYTPNFVLTGANSAFVYDQTGSSNKSCRVLTTSFTNDYPQITFKCDSNTNITSLYIRFYNSSNNYLFEGSKEWYWNYSYFRKRTSNTSDNTGEIIDGIQQNTQDIINNQNQNTQDIINNNNQNTQDIINSNKVCSNYNVNVNYNNKDSYNNGYLKNDGTIQSSDNNWRYTDYMILYPDNTFILSGNGILTSNASYCLYDKNKSLVSCTKYTSNTITIDVDETSYIRYSTYVGSSSYSSNFKGDNCRNGSQALDDSINNLDDTINDDDTSGAESEASEFFSSFNTETFGLTSIITSPLNLIRSVLSSACTDLQLPLPYLDNKKLTLPCMNTIYSQFFGSFFTIYQTITYGIIAYWVCVRIFNQVKDFKNPEHDEIEVMDL